MSEITNITNVFWVNESKTRVSCVAEYDNGTAEQLSVGVDENSPFWQKISALVPTEDIDAATDEMQDRVRARRKVDAYREQERTAQKKMNALFNAKIEAFEIQAVARASSERKAKIRKAKSLTEVAALVAIAIIESEKQ